MTRLRLLIVDGHGGPSPRDYLPALSPLAELRMIYVSQPAPERSAGKEEVLPAYGHVVTVPAVDQIPDAAAQIARSWPPDGLFAQSENVLYDAARAAGQLGV